MFRDWQSAYYLKGLSHEIWGMTQFLAWQEEHRATTFSHTTSLYTIGVSAGAYAAIACGFFLKAHVVWALAPPRTHFDSAEAGQLLASVTDPISTQCLDLAQLLAQGNGVTEYRIFYNQEFDRDREAGVRLQHCPGVTLHPQPGQGHQIVTTLNNQGRLPDLLEPFKFTEANP